MLTHATVFFHNNCLVEKKKHVFMLKCKTSVRAENVSKMYEPNYSISKPRLKIPALVMLLR